MPDTYNCINGWAISYLPEGSQHWRAHRFGVRMRAHTREALVAMIHRQGKPLSFLDA